MLLYEYPPKQDKRTSSIIEFNASMERKKIRKNAVKNVVIGVAIAALSFAVPNIPVRIFVLTLAGFELFIAYFLYRSTLSINSKNNCSRIYDDHIEHRQTGVMSGRITEFNVCYEDIESSAQNAVGDLVIKLNENNSAEMKRVKGGKIEALPIKNNCVVLVFNNSEPKYYLINNLYEKIRYPKKEYLPYVDDEEEEDNW